MRLIRFLKRLIRWLPVLWKQEEWDYSYLYDLIEFKLKELKQALEKDKLHKDSNEYAKQILDCLTYLDKYRNWDKYLDFPENCCMINNNELAYIEDFVKLLGVIEKFEQTNYRLFWKTFIKYHRNWWC